jgi:hypothetical protein
MAIALVALHDANCFLNLALVTQILHQVRHHLLNAAQQIFYPVKRKEVLLVALLVKVTA